MQFRTPLSEPALAFVVALGASSSEEVELQLQGRMEFSKAAVSRVVEASDCLQRQVEELCQRVYSRGEFFRRSPREGHSPPASLGGPLPNLSNSWRSEFPVNSQPCSCWNNLVPGEDSNLIPEVGLQRDDCRNCWFCGGVTPLQGKGSLQHCTNLRGSYCPTRLRRVRAQAFCDNRLLPT